MPTGHDVAVYARRLTGYRYLFGGELDPLGPPGDCDCSELVEWAVAQAGAEDGTGVRITDGSWLQYQACQHIPLNQALQTTGALVFLTKSDPPQEGRDGIYHVGIVDAAAGEIVEACCSDGDPIKPSPIGKRDWYRTAGLIPGVTYSDTTEDDMGVITIRAGEPGEGSTVLIAAGRHFGVNSAEDRVALADAFGEAAVSRELYDRITQGVPQG